MVVVGGCDAEEVAGRPVAVATWSAVMCGPHGATVLVSPTRW